MNISLRQRKNLQFQVFQSKCSKKREGGALGLAAPCGLCETSIREGSGARRQEEVCLKFKSSVGK